MVSGLPIAVLPFMTPWLFFAGAAATSVPIIIHLLNRRRFRIIVWAAMDFLLAAQRRNARRLKFQRWLLLILRIAALLVLAAAVAQFFLQNSALANVLGAGERVVVVVWDDSYSMAYQPPGLPSHFEQSRKLLIEWLANLPSADKVAIVRASRGAEPLVRTPSLDHGAVRNAVAQAAVSDAGTDLAGAFDKVLEILRDKQIERTARSRSVLLITDLSRSSLPSGNGNGGTNGGANGGGGGEQLKKILADLKDIAKIRVADIGRDDQFNRGLTGLETFRPVVIAGRPVDLNLTVENGSDNPMIDEPVQIAIDGIATDQKMKLPRIDPGGRRATAMTLQIPTPGRHVIEAKIGDDLLPADNVRRLVVNVVREIPLLIVDGSPSERDHYSGGTFLQAVYDPRTSDNKSNAFVAKVISELELPTSPLSQFAMVAWCDPGTPSAKVAENLKRFVDEGGLLVIFPGRRTTPKGLNDTLGSGTKDAANILPAALGDSLKPAGGVSLDMMAYGHPVLRLFRDAVRSGQSVGLSTVQTMQYLRLTVPADGATETILKYADGPAGTGGGGGGPAVVSRQIGKGRVVLFASAAESEWNSFPGKPSFVSLMQEIAYWGISRDTAAGGGRLTLRVGERLHIPAAVAEAGAWAGPHNTTVQVTTTVDEKDKRAWLTSAPLTMAGTYSPVKTAGPAVAAVNPDDGEADIRHVKPAEFAAALTLERSDIMLQPKTLEVQLANGANNQGGELGRRLLLVALVLLTAEALFARLFSVYR